MRPMTIDATEFIRHFILHILLRGLIGKLLDGGCRRAFSNGFRTPPDPGLGFGGTYHGSASALLLYAGSGGSGAAWTGRPGTLRFRPRGTTRSRYMTSSYCTSGWHGSHHISPHTSSVITLYAMSCVILLFMKDVASSQFC